MDVGSPVQDKLQQLGDGANLIKRIVVIIVVVVVSAVVGGRARMEIC